ncbi:MAG: hypothetical protein ACPGWS_04515, partial [Solirubrobacterales bacterium]
MNTHAAYELDAILERYELALTAKAAPAVLPGIRRKAEQAIEKASASAFRALSRRINMTGLRGALRDGDIDEAVSNVP